jgi:hypothetical protein
LINLLISIYFFFFFLPCISWYRESHLTTRFVFLKSSFYMAFFPISFCFVVCFCTQLTVLFFQTPGYYPWMHEQNKLVNGEYHIVLFVRSSFFFSVCSYFCNEIYSISMIWVACLLLNADDTDSIEEMLIFWSLFMIRVSHLLWRRDEMRPIRCSVDNLFFINPFMFLLLFLIILLVNFSSLWQCTDF